MEEDKKSQKLFRKLEGEMNFIPIEDLLEEVEQRWPQKTANKKIQKANYP